MASTQVTDVPTRRNECCDQTMVVDSTLSDNEWERIHILSIKWQLRRGWLACLRALEPLKMALFTTVLCHVILLWFITSPVIVVLVSTMLYWYATVVARRGYIVVLSPVYDGVLSTPTQ